MSGCYCSEGKKYKGPQRALGRLCRQLGKPWKPFRGFSWQLGRLLRQMAAGWRFGGPTLGLNGPTSFLKGPT